MTAREEQLDGLLERLGKDDGSAANELMPHVYDELHRLARGVFRSESAGHTLQPTALVHEAFLQLVGHTRTRWAGRSHFLAVAALVMRRLLAEHARKKQALKRGGGWQRVTLDGLGEAAAAGELDVLDLHEALEELAALDERQARIVEYRFFGGLTVVEIAEVLELGTTTVQDEWAVAKAWLHDRLDA
ncbi:MAG: ECF-type sigma factor [Acidobacteriota bacterium]